MAPRPGLVRTEDFVVNERMLTDVGGTLATPVLSTPSMIGVMERNAARLVAPHLDNGQASVGFEVCVKHVASAAAGAACLARAELREVIAGRKLRFSVEVREGERTIGFGTHERRVISADRDVAANAAA